MVAVGAVIKVTPLHSVGQALANGGVGFLGTEFEGPMRAMESAKQILYKMKIRKEDQEVIEFGQPNHISLSLPEDDDDELL
mmetsp:Transcript_524/g.705  ORF Transcript_524/g.705 Transcript_524/m.705 type:complete len:81 (-) Transcript_524:35-277(-)